MKRRFPSFLIPSFNPTLPIPDSLSSSFSFPSLSTSPILLFPSHFLSPFFFLFLSLSLFPSLSTSPILLLIFSLLFFFFPFFPSHFLSSFFPPFFLSHFFSLLSPPLSFSLSPPLSFPFSGRHVRTESYHGGFFALCSISIFKKSFWWFFF